MLLKIILVICFICASLSSVLCLSLSSDEKPVAECAHNTYPPTGTPKVPLYVINLDLPPEQRWHQIGKKKSAEIANIATTLKNVLLSAHHEFQLVIDLVDKHMGAVVDTLPMPYRDEIKGLSKASGINLGELMFLNMAYEVFAYCTSIIAQTPYGTLYHARNLDFGAHLGWDPKTHTWNISEALRPVTVTLDWQRNKTTVFKSVNYAGYVGVLTGIKPGAFTFSLDLRRNIDGGYIGIIKWLLGDRSASWASLLIRQALEDATSYTEAKHLLSNTRLLAPVYFILGGIKSQQACVITRSREKAVDVWDIGTRGSTWYVVQTNYDHWQSDPSKDPRCTVAKYCLKNMTQQNVGFPGLFDVLSTKPVLNPGTTYTTLMQSNSGLMETYIQQ